jgi:hypothetical protein
LRCGGSRSNSVPRPNSLVVGNLLPGLWRARIVCSPIMCQHDRAASRSCVRPQRPTRPPTSAPHADVVDRIAKQPEQLRGPLLLCGASLAGRGRHSAGRAPAVVTARSGSTASRRAMFVVLLALPTHLVTHVACTCLPREAKGYRALGFFRAAHLLPACWRRGKANEVRARPIPDDASRIIRAAFHGRP